MAKTDITDFGKLLRSLLDEARMTQDELANELGLTKENISLWVHGKRTPRREYVVKIIQILNGKGAIVFQSEADRLLAGAKKPKLDGAAVTDQEAVGMLRTTLTDEEKWKKDAAILYFVVTAILLAFAIFMAAGTPILPDEIIPGLLAMLTGKKGYDEMAAYLEILRRSNIKSGQ